MEAENIIINKIKRAFAFSSSLSHEAIESNPYKLEEGTPEEFRESLPSFMIYVLRSFREEPQSTVYMQLLFNLNEYSKSKSLQVIFNNEQQTAILAFLQHLLHNQPANIDEEEIQKIINRL